VLSVRRVRNPRPWVQLEEMQRSGSVIEAVVIEANRGVSEKAATQQSRRDRKRMRDGTAFRW
jgi:hypothetical protein